MFYSYLNIITNFIKSKLMSYKPYQNLACNFALSISSVFCVAGFSNVAYSHNFHDLKNPQIESKATFSNLVDQQLYSQLDQLTQKILADKKQMSLNGVKVFKAKDPFLPGKIATGFGHLVIDKKNTPEELAQAIQNFSASADLSVDMEMHTWGIYYYLLALHDLHKANLLNSAVSAETLAKLKVKLDWKTFVTEPNYELIKLPTNYYGVAFGIARLRLLLGWEDEKASQGLLAKLLQHYDTHSGEFGFSDETDGEGRFDRYSILLIAEICERLIETDMEVPDDLKLKLRKAADIALALINQDGYGFTIGRSIGVYGETAMLEILATSAYLNVLTPSEKDYSYAFSTKVLNRYLNFWYNPKMQSIDLWEQGRKTDAYRGMHRILGENFSIIHQFISINKLWSKAGYDAITPKSDISDWVSKTQPAFKFTWFARGEFDRALAIYRDKSTTFSLLLANGGAGQHGNSPYFPIPLATDIISGVADSSFTHNQLIPTLSLADGSKLIGTAFLKNIKNVKTKKGYEISYQQDELTKIGANNISPIKDKRIQVSTSYQLQSGYITRTDTYHASSPIDVNEITLSFASFSDKAIFKKASGTNIQFKEGRVKNFSVSGFDQCLVKKIEDADGLKANYGAMKSNITCTKKAFTLEKPLKIQWRMHYQ
jgi:hypothetical protein